MEALREKPDVSQPVLLPVMTEDLTLPLIAAGASAGSDGTRSAYLPVAEVAATFTFLVPAAAAGLSATRRVYPEASELAGGGNDGGI
jgi:hypothetical protein